VIVVLFVWFSASKEFCVVACNINVRNWASWSHRPFTKGDVENDFSLLLSTNTLSIAVPE
jgi:hypothetical protein